ncbi:MAG: helix-turn-helix domain-containing protein [Gemmatimonadetes bacterium]|nr:helix-turn-helix domain-containing protein [Gemmatimonadota bacterium]
MEKTQIPKLLYVREAAELTGIQRWRLYSLIKAGKGPRHMRIGKTIRISVVALAEWIDQQHHVTTEEEE